MRLRSDVAVGQHLARQALSWLKLTEFFYKRKRVLSRAAVLAANALASMPSPALGETRASFASIARHHIVNYFLSQ